MNSTEFIKESTEQTFLSRNSKILFFLKRLAIFIVLLVVLDRIIAFGMKKLYFSQKKGLFAQMTYALDSTNQEVLIFGSSRAIRQYSPDIISKGLNKTCYNVGKDAQMIPYYQALQEVIFQRYKPETVILDINPWELKVGPEKYDKLSVLLPYCAEHPELLKYIGEGGDWNGLEKLSKTYLYNSTLLISVSNLIFEKDLAKDANGYSPLLKTMDRAREDINRELTKKEAARISPEKSNKIDQKALNYYITFLNTCAKYNIKTYVVISPVYYYGSGDLRKTKLKEIAEKYKNVKFLDFAMDKNFLNQDKKFADAFHLNKQGAEDFSRELLKYL